MCVCVCVCVYRVWHIDYIALEGKENYTYTVKLRLCVFLSHGITRTSAVRMRGWREAHIYRTALRRVLSTRWRESPRLCTTVSDIFLSSCLDYHYYERRERRVLYTTFFIHYPLCDRSPPLRARVSLRRATGYGIWSFERGFNV